MITGSVSVSLEPLISLVVQHSNGPQQTVSVLVDTGFNGCLTLPPNLIHSLGLVWLCLQQGELADGSTGTFEVYAVQVLWHGQWRDVETYAANAIPLGGMGLLEGSRLEIEVNPGGGVTIDTVP